jgi:hypothetical protein
MSYDEIEQFVQQIASKAAVEMKRINQALNGPVAAESELAQRQLPEDEGEALESHFCYGIGPKQIKAKRCYLDRYIHPSWSEADSVSCIEWFRAFKRADETLNGSVTALLRIMWEREKLTRTDIK